MRPRRWTHLLAFALLGATAAPAAGQAPTGGGFLEATHAGPAGARAYRLFVPGGYDGKAAVPLLVMLHGCTQSAADFAAGTRMNELAEQKRVLVAYPEQPASANPLRCWNWFDPAHQARDAGEPAALAALTRDVMSRYRVDPRRVFVAGVSAGAAMAVTLGTTYPDLFAAVGSHSGAQFGAATSVMGARTVMAQGGPDPATQARLARAAMAGHARAVPLIVFHGAADPVVAPVNAGQTVEQWARTADLADDGAENGSVDLVPDDESQGAAAEAYRWKRLAYSDAAGRPLVEWWVVEGLGHAWSGGAPGGSFTDPKGPDASGEMLRFFLANPMKQDQAR